MGPEGFKWLASIRARGLRLPDWPLDVQYFLTVQREIHIWRGGRPLQQAERGSENTLTAKVSLDVNTPDVKVGHFDLPRRCHPGWTWPPGSSGLSAGRWQNRFSLQKQHKQPLSQRYKRPRLKYHLKLKSVLLHCRVLKPLAVFNDRFIYSFSCIKTITGLGVTQGFNKKWFWSEKQEWS